MTATLPTISRNELLTELKQTPKPILVDALPRAHYFGSHLPGAVNLPVGDEFKAAEILPNKDAEIVVYCKNST